MMMILHTINDFTDLLILLTYSRVFVMYSLDAVTLKAMLKIILID